MTLPARSRKLVESTPIHPRESGASACIEFTIYADGHAGIAVSRVEGKPPNRRIVQADSLPLNDRRELLNHIGAILDLVESRARADA
jgi:hypothetical protein